MFRLRKKIPLDRKVCLEPGDKLQVTWQQTLNGVVFHEELLVEDYVQEGETEEYDTALVIDFENELGMKKGYLGGVGKELE